jgi:hypothetical protein
VPSLSVGRHFALHRVYDRHSRNYAQTTVEAYTLALRQFAEYFHRPPDQLGPEHIQEFQLPAVELEV